MAHAVKLPAFSVTEPLQLKNEFLRWLAGFKPQPATVSTGEKLRASLGALTGILLTGFATWLMLGGSASLPVLIAPMGASALLLFAVPASPLAQPWSIIGGNFVAATIGVTCALYIPEPLLAAPLAMGLSVILMFALRCLHPPSGAVALTAVLGGPAILELGYQFVWAPVMVNSLLLLATAIVFNNATRHRYPHAAKAAVQSHGTRDLSPGDRMSFTTADLEGVLKQYNEVIDVSRDDLESLFHQAEMHAYGRRFGHISCADIMSRDVITVEFGTPLEEAWQLLRSHNIKALPVIDRARRVIGIVTQIDFLRHADLDVYEGFADRLRRFVRQTTGRYSEKPEVVGQIMSKPVTTASMHMHIVQLVPVMSDLGLHYIPIIDGKRKLVGMVTQSDLVAALYRGRLEEAAAA
jgi:CBS domain-containing membrane protein